MIIESDIDDLYKTVPRLRKESLLKNKLGSIATDLKLTSAEGIVVSLRKYIGTPLLIVFASSECSSCSVELNKLYLSAQIRRAIDLNRLSVAVVFIDNAIPDYAGTLREFEIYRDNHGQILDREIYTARILPSLYLLDCNQNVLMRESTVGLFLKNFYTVCPIPKE